ncbi:YiiD C-terminal domain-containing protein [Nocardia sp. NPDC049149]|uniref:YiiD C-terminal domain-containing protein n=1 Tax=Nocardia sp. NPDC049149 TaxID=3364315 RepID=UPI0037224E42
MDETVDGRALVEMFNAGLAHAVPAMYELGVRLVELAPGRAVGMVPMDTNRNHFGGMYAGALFAVAEMLGGAVALASCDASRFYPIVKDMQINYRRPATTDVRACAELGAAEIESIVRQAEATGKAEFTLDAVLTDASGVTVATTHGTYQIRAR